MKVAFVGCGHGHLDLIYSQLIGSEVDALVVCGDFEACRNEQDLQCLAGPSKYHFLKDYWKYYKGTAVAPILTIFVGGNHEASNHLWELYYGGWAAPNIYFLGYSGVIKIGDFRLAGISGIYDHRDFRKGHHERLPYNDSTVRSIFHTRECEITGPIDAFISHDWPMEISKHGDLKELYGKHRGVQDQIEAGTFGSPAHWELLQKIRPNWWVSGHMHVRYQAAYSHPGGASQTKFLALSKSIPEIAPRDWMAIINFPDKTAGPLCYDEEWLAILRATHTPSFFQQSAKVPFLANLEEIPRQIEKVKERFSKREGEYKISPVPFPGDVPPSPLAKGVHIELPREFTQNSQTVNFILELGLPFPGLCEEPKAQEEVSKLMCGTCKSEFSIPKKALLALEHKGLPPPGECKQCQRKKNVKTGWR